MGGGSSCIELSVELRNAAGEVVKGGPSVPLKATLHYADDGELVRQQKILTVSDHALRISESDGTAQLKARIEEVSRRHQNRYFLVQVSVGLLLNCSSVLGSWSHWVLSKPLLCALPSQTITGSALTLHRLARTRSRTRCRGR